MINVAFIGNWGTAKEILTLLLNHSSFCVKFVLTQYSNEQKEDLWFNMVWDFALSQSIPVFPQNVFKNNDNKIMELLEGENVDLVVSCAYPFLIRRSVIDFMNKRNGIVNIHGSFLPKYRGTTPVLWAIINNDDDIGITLHYIDEGCDSGDIISQGKIKNNIDKSLDELTDELKLEGCNIFKKYLDDMADGKEIKRITQDSKESSNAPRIKGSTLKMNFNESYIKIRSFFKATQNINPYFVCKGEHYIIRGIGELSTNVKFEKIQIKDIFCQSVVISIKEGDLKVQVDKTDNLFIGDIIG
jgi:methionyl-tRNA formyltransferase